MDILMVAAHTNPNPNFNPTPNPNPNPNPKWAIEFLRMGPQSQQAGSPNCYV